MKKIMAIVLIALFSATVAFAGNVTNAAPTPVPSKTCKKMGKHHGGKKCNKVKPAAAATPAK